MNDKRGASVWVVILVFFVVLSLIVFGVLVYGLFFKQDANVAPQNTDEENPIVSDLNDDEKLLAAVSCTEDVYNCADFEHCQEAIEVFNLCETDVHRLDNNKDGIPCESICV